MARATTVAGSRTLTLRGYPNKHVTVRAGGKGLYAVGNYYLFVEDLRNRAGQHVGIVSARCTYNVNSETLCDGVIVIATPSMGGVHGKLSFYGRPAEYAITGGVGDFQGARGSLFDEGSTGTGSSKHEVLQVTLLP